MNWAEHYPAYSTPEKGEKDAAKPRSLAKDVTVADIGCGFGGLLVALAPQLPDELLLGGYLCTRQISLADPKVDTQVLKSVCKSLNLFKTASAPFAHKTQIPSYTRTSPAYVPTP